MGLRTSGTFPRTPQQATDRFNTGRHRLWIGPSLAVAVSLRRESACAGIKHDRRRGRNPDIRILFCGVQRGGTENQNYWPGITRQLGVSLRLGTQSGNRGARRPR